MLIRCMTLADLLRLVRGESLRICAEALGVPRTTLLANIDGERFLLASEAESFGVRLGSYAGGAGFDGRAVKEMFAEAYAFEAGLRECLGGPGLFRAAAGCASAVLSRYVVTPFSRKDAAALLGAVLSGAPADGVMASYLLWRAGMPPGEAGLEESFVRFARGAVYDVLMSLVRATRVEFDPGLREFWVACEPFLGEPVRRRAGAGSPCGRCRRPRRAALAP